MVADNDNIMEKKTSIHPSPPTVLRVPQYAQYLHNQSATMPRGLRKHVWSGARSGAHNLFLTILTTSSEDVGDVSFTRHPFSSHPPDDVLGSKTSGSTYSLKLSFQFVCYPVILISLFGLYTFTPNSLSLFQGGRHVLGMSCPKYPKDEDLEGGYVGLVNLSKSLHIHYPTPSHK